MSNTNPTPETPPEPKGKKSIGSRLGLVKNTDPNDPPKKRLITRQRLERGFAVVGVLTVAGVAAAALSNRKPKVDIEVTAPAVDISTTETESN